MSGLDDGIRHYVELLQSKGVETCQSCQGGPGHTYLEPTVDFRGGRGEGLRALGVALTHGLPVSELRRVWSIEDGEPTGPIWSMVFSKRSDTHDADVEAHAARWFAFA